MDNDEERLSFKERDRKRLEAEKRFAKEHPERIESNKRIVAREKTTKLKSRLNKLILGVIILIILDYLVLFFL